jgi:hypothetical protein
MGFGLVIAFIDHWQIAPTTNFSLFLFYAVYNQSTLIFSAYFYQFSLSHYRCTTAHITSHTKSYKAQ